MNIEVLRLEGRLDTTRVGEVELAFSAKAGSLKSGLDAAIIDLHDCSFMSSMGVRLLITTLKQFQRRGVRFVTINPTSSVVHDTLVFANISELLNLVDSELDARDTLSSKT